jgi:hypothetical protein
LMWYRLLQTDQVIRSWSIVLSGKAHLKGE